MKKETFVKAETLLQNKKKVIEDIQQVVDGRGKYYNSNTREHELNISLILDYIIIGSLNRRKSEIQTLRLDFKEDSLETKNNFEYLSEKSRVLIEHLSNSYKEAISNILLHEEKRIQLEFDSLKDE